MLIETILAAFEMDEILYELREHSAGLNAGRWDYIFSCIKKFKLDRDFCLADRAKVTMTAPFMRAYALLLLKTCHRRGAPAIGGMSALIPIKNDPAKNEIAMAGDHRRQAARRRRRLRRRLGRAPGPRRVGDEGVRRRCSATSRTSSTSRSPTCTSRPPTCSTSSPRRRSPKPACAYNINVGIHYLGAWLAGNGCVPIHNLMEDAATAEISRSQVWQWIRSPKGVLDDGRKVTADLVRALSARSSPR